MGHIKPAHYKESSNKKGDKLVPTQKGIGTCFMLSDVSRTELENRRIPVYPILL